MNLNQGNKGALIFLGVSLLVFTGYIFQQSKEDKLHANLKTTVGKVTGIKHASKSRFYIEFEFYGTDGMVQGNDPLRATWPEYIREGKVEINRYYPVEYDSEDPKNSKISITKEPYTEAQLLRNGIQVDAKVEKAMKVSKDYVDLRIKYKHNHESFKFRTRLHKDSLPCGSIESCNGSMISLKINEQFPELNVLYFKSYDRKHKLREYGFQ